MRNLKFSLLRGRFIFLKLYLAYFLFLYVISVVNAVFNHRHVFGMSGVQAPVEPDCAFPPCLAIRSRPRGGGGVVISPGRLRRRSLSGFMSMSSSINPLTRCHNPVSDDEAVAAVADLLGSDISALVGEAAEMPRLEEDPATTATPDVMYILRVEETPVGRTAGLKNALLLWAVAHVVYAQRVRRNSRRALYLFVQQFVLHITDATLPKVCWRVAEALGASTV